MKLDGVVVASPTIFHVASAEKFLQDGVPTFVEKPLAATIDEAEHLNQLAVDSDTVLQVGHIERFNPAFDAAQQRCGTPLYIRSQRVAPYTFRSTDIGVVLDLMIHDIDLVLALTGEMPSSVDAFGAVGIGPNEDMAIARLKMPSGAIVDLTSSRMNPTAERTLQIWGTDGCVSADLHARTVDHWKPNANVAANPALISAIASATADPRTLKDRVFGEWIDHETIEATGGDQMEAELRNFISAITTGAPVRVPGSAGVAAMKVANQVLESLTAWSYQTNQPVAARPTTDQKKAA